MENVTGALWGDREAAPACHSPDGWGHGGDLTERECEVLAHVTFGKTPDEIANRLGVSCHTVNADLQRVYDKLNVSSRSEAIFWAVRLGLIPGVSFS